MFATDDRPFISWRCVVVSMSNPPVQKGPKSQMEGASSGGTCVSPCSAEDSALIGTVQTMDDINPVFGQVSRTCLDCAQAHIRELDQTLPAPDLMQALLAICAGERASWHPRFRTCEQRAH
jgi:hypothetical protein|eukprot:COSAG06_NODE_11356_length_1522_cov_2.654252_2_plen_121_part_00